MRYTNPIIPGFHPDPSICRVGAEYYLVTSSFEYFPAVPLFKSLDLVHWRQIGHCITRRSQLDLGHAPSSGGIYAPTIRFHQGRFYMITTDVDGKGNFYVYTDDTSSEWSEPLQVHQPGYDPSLFFDEDGRVYLTAAGGGIFQCEIDITTGKRLGPSCQIWSGTGGAYPEGPHLYKIGGAYYLMISEGGTEHGHMVTLARGSAPFGPFDPCPRNPILTHRSLHLPIKAVGHADLVQTQNGSWWMVCLGIRPVPYPWVHHLGRETFLAPVKWAADGWPVVGDNGMLWPEMEAEGLEPRPWPETRTRAGFGGPEWVHIRNPREEDYSIGESGLVLRGSKVSLDDTGSPACLCRRQEHFNCDAETLLDFQPQADGDQAGLAAYLNERFHYEIAVTRLEGARRVILRRRLGSLWKVERNEACPPGQVRLRIRADHEHYRFAFAPEAGPWRELGQGECRLLSTEVGGKFTGAVFCLYAVGHAAAFRWFEYRPHEKQWRLEP